jgi:exopolyphosphatase / guanosine-5'-triphosphate,3'-diphosphate pyrophosphatase
MRVATIDIGTNSVLLLVAETGRDAALTALREEATITRLGEGVDRTRTLAPAAIARTTACLDAYAAIVRDMAVDRVAVVGTSAMRDAGGGEAVRDHVRGAFGVEARTIAGDEEAELTFRGALSGVDGARGADEVSVFDVGGGSTEIVRGRPASGEILYARSFDVGSVRLTERHVKGDPPTEPERAAALADARSAFAELPPMPRGMPVIGIAGTVTTLAAVSAGVAPYDATRIHGMKITAAELRSVVDRLAAMSIADRRRVPGVHEKRADVIVAGGWVTLAALEALGGDELVVSDRGVRWGLAERLAAG